MKMVLRVISRIYFLPMETGNIDRLLTAVDEAMERADARNPEAKKVMKTDIK